jgi:hypothetical protein
MAVGYEHNIYTNNNDRRSVHDSVKSLPQLSPEKLEIEMYVDSSHVESRDKGFFPIEEIPSET